MKNSGKQKNDEIKLKDERIRLKPCDDLDGGFDEKAEEIQTVGQAVAYIEEHTKKDG